MKQRHLRVGVIAVMAWGWLSVAGAFAQTPGVAGMGLSLLTNEGTAAGFMVTASKELVSGSVGVGPVGDFSLHHDNATWTTFSGGVRVTGHPEEAKVMPFGQFLVGATIFNFGDLSTYLTFTYGGGVHVPIGEGLNLLFQFDLLNLRSGLGSGSTFKRTTIGVSIPVGTR